MAIATGIETATRTLTFSIKGIAPLMMHNGLLASPFYAYTKRLKEITKKRCKTEEDHYEIAKIEWEGGLYMSKRDADTGLWAENSHPIIPAECIYATLLSGAKAFKGGPSFKAGVFVTQFARLRYCGDSSVKTLADLRGKDYFIDSRLVDVNGNKVTRSRPIFHDWSCEFTVEFDPSVVDESDLVNWTQTGGRLKGLCELRPTFGRFTIESYK
jgi:hypothetical protein